MGVKNKESYGFFRILSLDGSDIYSAMHRKDGPPELTVFNKDGKFDVDLFCGTIDESLNTLEMESVYASCKQEMNKYEKFLVHKERRCMMAVINVSFKYTVKKYKKKPNGMYVLDGYTVDKSDLEDHVLISEEDGELKLLAVEVANKKNFETYEPVNLPISSELLGKQFFYNKQKEVYEIYEAYEEKKKAPESTSIKEIREYLYDKGFSVDGVHYVRYMRSAGAGRSGTCLFIAEPLYKAMMEWTNCGLDPKAEYAIKDQASWQAYQALTLSTIIGIVNIPKNGILLIRDQVSTFREKVVNVTANGSILSAKVPKGKVKIKNVIWDGEALLDRSVFEENGFEGKGMMLLRNRFFKTCAFNTNLQKWFEDNNITDIKQLNGVCIGVTSVKDIKLVITESSLKYLKFKTPSDKNIKDQFKRWIKHVYGNRSTAAFGVVKTDKSTGFMDGRMVKTNYQLLNTIQLSNKQAKDFVKPSLDFLKAMKKDPAYVRYYSHLFARDEHEAKEDITAENYRQKLVVDMTSLSDDFKETPFYREYQEDNIKSFQKKLKHGKILVDGAYHTLFGNCVEFLHAVVKGYKVGEPEALKDGEIYAPRFKDGEELLCERSPHITMGNLYIVKNKYVEEIDKYFNLRDSKTIVCVNAINSNIQQRLNGCDYDSDTMLITNNEILLNAAKMNYEKFLVPYCSVKPISSDDSNKDKNKGASDDLAEIDRKISQTRTGEIVNLSQFLNSLYWDKLYSGDLADLDDLYKDICKLAVLSGIEIDRAKRSFDVITADVLRELRIKHKKPYLDANSQKVPTFFIQMTGSTNEKSGSDKAKLSTPMSFIYDEVKSSGKRDKKSDDSKITYSALFGFEDEQRDNKKRMDNKNGIVTKRAQKILKTVAETNRDIKAMNYRARTKDYSERNAIAAEKKLLFDECREKVGKWLEYEDDSIYYMLLKKLDGDCKDDEEKKTLNSCRSLLFAMICYARDGYLINKIKRSEEMFDLLYLEDESNVQDGDWIFGHRHIKGRKYKK